jgi:putative membrane protein insertion efficiency factor
MTPFGVAAISLIRVYQWVISPLLPRSCRFAPSCSEYAAEAIQRHGALAGFWLTARRLLRCHPWGGDGYDPVPDHPSLHLPWRQLGGCGHDPAAGDGHTHPSHPHPSH